MFVLPCRSTSAREGDEPRGRCRRRFTPAQKDAGVNGADLVSERSHDYAPAARDHTGRQQRHDRHAESCFDHADDRFGSRRLERDARRQRLTVKGVEHVLPTGRAAFVQDQPFGDDMCETQTLSRTEWMIEWTDGAPPHREQVLIVQLGGWFIRSGEPNQTSAS